MHNYGSTTFEVELKINLSAVEPKKELYLIVSEPGNKCTHRIKNYDIFLAHLVQSILGENVYSKVSVEQDFEKTAHFFDCKIYLMGKQKDFELHSPFVNFESFKDSAKLIHAFVVECANSDLLKTKKFKI